MPEAPTAGTPTVPPPSWRKMRAAVCRAFGEPFSLETVSLAPPGSADVTVRLRATSICHSDVIFADGGWGGELPAIYGHEGAGVVEEVGADVSDLKPGDHVVLTMVRSCGSCPCCALGHRGCCEHVFDPTGGAKLLDDGGTPIFQGLKSAAFADYATAHRSQVVKMDRDLAFDVAAVLACGVITGYGSVVNSAGMRPDANVVVIGVGGVGLNCIQAARIRGAKRIIAMDRMAGRLEAARTFGATDGIDITVDDPAKSVLDRTGGRGADYVFVAAGSRPAIESSFGLLAPGGMAVLVGIPEIGAETSFDPIVLANASKRIVGSKLGDADVQRDIPDLIELYREGDLMLDQLITERFSFDEINQAMAMARSGAGLKTVVLFEDA